MKDDEQCCPDCAEVIKKAANVCKHCGYRLVPLDNGFPTEAVSIESLIEPATAPSNVADGPLHKRTKLPDHSDVVLTASPPSWPERVFDVKPGPFWAGCGLLLAIPFLGWALLGSPSSAPNRKAADQTVVADANADEAEREAEAAMAAADEAMADASAAMSGDSPRVKASAAEPDEIEIVTLCDLTLKESLMSPSSLDGSYKWDYSFDGNNTAVVQRKFEHKNGFGAKIRSEYLCEVNTNTQEINKLVVNGPMGATKVI